MQGGGAFIENGGSATFTGCNIFNNEAGSVRARIFDLLDPSSSAPLERYVTDCILLHAGRRGRDLVGRVCQLRCMQHFQQYGSWGALAILEPSEAFFQRPAGTLHD